MVIACLLRFHLPIYTLCKNMFLLPMFYMDSYQCLHFIQFTLFMDCYFIWIRGYVLFIQSMKMEHVALGFCSFTANMTVYKCPFPGSNNRIWPLPVYCVFIYQFILYARTCSSYRYLHGQLPVPKFHPIYIFMDCYFIWIWENVLFIRNIWKWSM